MLRLLLIISTACYASSAPAVAQDLATPTVINGVEGVWLPLPMARDLQVDAEEARELRQQVRLLTDQLQLAHDRHENSQHAINLGRIAEERAVGALETALRLQREAEDARDAWYRQPSLWFATGVVAAVLSVVSWLLLAR